MKYLFAATALLFSATVGAQQDELFRQALMEHLLTEIAKGNSTPYPGERQLVPPARLAPPVTGITNGNLGGPQWVEPASTIRPMRMCGGVGQFVSCF
jgi:hypothetical protein